MSSVYIKHIKKGETFFECEYGYNDEYVAVSDPYRFYVGQENEGWAIDAISPGGKEVRFFNADNASAYHPKLYCSPQYMFTHY